MHGVIVILAVFLLYAIVESLVEWLLDEIEDEKDNLP